MVQTGPTLAILSQYSSLHLRGVFTAGYQPAQDYLEEKIRANPFLCDPSVNVKEDYMGDWKDMDDLRPLALPYVLGI